MNAIQVELLRRYRARRRRERAGAAAAPPLDRRASPPRCATPARGRPGGRGARPRRRASAASSRAAPTRCPSRTRAPSGPTSSTASPASKPPSQATTPTREQARAVLDERAARARVDARCGRATGLPKRSQSLNAGSLALGGREAGAARLAGEDRLEHGVARARPRSPSGCRPRRRAPRRATLLRIPPRPSGLVVAERGLRRRAPSAISSAPGVPGRARVDAVDLRQQDEQPARASEHGDLRGERVVVAERDLVGGGRVVLVHDRDGAEREQRVERVAGVDVGRAVGDVGGGEQDLRRRRAGARAPSSQAAWSRAWPSADAAWSCATLPRPAVEAEARQPERDRAGGDDADRLAAATIARDLARRARAAATRRTRPPGPATRLEPSLTTTRHRRCVPSPTTRYWRSQRSRYVTGPRGPGTPVDVDPGLGRAGQLEAVGEPRRRVPEGGRAAVAVEEALGRGRVLGDDPRGEAGGLVVRDPQPPRRGRRRASTRHGRDALRVARPLVADRRVERPTRAVARRPRTSSAVRREQRRAAARAASPRAPRSTSARLSRLQTPSRSRLASASASAFSRVGRRVDVEHAAALGVGERPHAVLGGEPRERRRRLGPLPRRITSGTSAGSETSDARALAVGRAHEPDRAPAAARPARAPAAAPRRRAPSTVRERRAARAEDGGVQALQQLRPRRRARRSAAPRSSRRRRRSGSAARARRRPFASVRVPISRSSGWSVGRRLELRGELVDARARRGAAGRASPRRAARRGLDVGGVRLEHVAPAARAASAAARSASATAPSFSAGRRLARRPAPPARSAREPPLSRPFDAAAPPLYCLKPPMQRATANTSSPWPTPRLPVRVRVCALAGAPFSSVPAG